MAESACLVTKLDPKPDSLSSLTGLYPGRPQQRTSSKEDSFSSFLPVCFSFSFLFLSLYHSLVTLCSVLFLLFHLSHSLVSSRVFFPLAPLFPLAFTVDACEYYFVCVHHVSHHAGIAHTVLEKHI